MMRAALVLAIATIAVLAKPVRSDPSFTVPAPSAPAPGESAPENYAPRLSTPDITGQSAPAAPPAVPKPSPPAATASAEESGRYSFHRIGDNFIRLDTQTGQVAQCGWAATGWSCQAAADERAALDSEIARLQRENVELKKSLLSHGLALPQGMVAEVPSQPAPVPPAKIPDTTPNKDAKGPSDADLDRALAYVKHIWRRLVDMMIELQRDIQKKS